MDQGRFADVTRSITRHPSRRDVLRGLAGAGLALGSSRIPDGAAAMQRRKQRPRVNQYGCLDVGARCAGKDARCCSGICRGKKGKSRCVAHHQSTCRGAAPVCSDPVPCRGNGSCFQTTGRAGFCGVGTSRECAPCQKDKDCETAFGLGAACIVCGPTCVGVNGSNGTACVPAFA